jgi:hypothetical protein
MSQRIIETRKEFHSTRNGCTPYNHRSYLDSNETSRYLSKLKERHYQYLDDLKKVSDSGYNPFNSLRGALSANFSSTDNYQVWEDRTDS